LLKKIGPGTNAITWFEIPVNNTERAKKFYETILDIQMELRKIEETNESLILFPFEEGVVRATSGLVSGVLTKNNHSKPSADGTVIYLNAYPEIQPVIDRIEPAGGKIVPPKIKIMAGYIARFIDSEGNQVGLHSEE
jgi:uncharacterized protein